MATITIKYQGKQTGRYEYGYAVEAVDKWQAIVPASVVGTGANSIEIGRRILAAQPSLSGAVSGEINFETKLSDGSYVYRGTRTRLNSARREDDFKLYWRSSLTGTTSPVDYFGNLLWVSYNGVPQTAEVDVDVPLYEVRCTGLRDITPIGNVVNLQVLWTGAVNSDTFNANQSAAIGARSLRCEGVEAEPIYYKESTGENVHRITFTFLGRDGGWRDTIYWRDPTTGLPPYDLTTSNWIKEVQKYKEMDFDQAWPFGSETGV